MKPQAFTFTVLDGLDPRRHVTRIGPARLGSSGGSGVPQNGYEKQSAAMPAALNPPGHWNFFGSHTQRDADAKLLVSELRSDCEKAGFWFWVDVKMKNKSVAAMKEVRRSCGPFE